MDGADALDWVLSIPSNCMDEEAKAHVDRYVATRLDQGDTVRQILTENTVQASIAVNVYIANNEPADGRRFERAYETSAAHSFVERALRAFYASMTVAGIRTAGEPFAALVDSPGASGRLQ